MMILLALLAVGLLTLSTISLRSSNSGLAQSEARSNARMAAMMAIGQLQSLTGLDTRVTASARLLDEENIEVSGVWRSWEGTNHDSGGRPIVPDYGSKNQSGDPSEALGGTGSGRFLGWLTSTSFGDNADSSQIPGSSTTRGSDQIKMVSTGTLDTADEVYLEPTIITAENGDEEGALSWWTTGDNSKALVNVDEEQIEDAESDWQQRVRGNRLPDPEVFGLKELDDLTTDDTYVASRRSLELVDGGSTLTGDEFYDLTTHSRGLLTNVATGGWRKDLSILSEYYDRHGRTNLPFFSNRPGEDLSFNRTTTSSRPSNALLYHWKDYLGRSSEAGWRQTPAVCSWTALTNYMMSYEGLRSRSPAAVLMNPQGGKVGERYDFQEEIRINPEVARIQWVFSLGAVQEGEELLPGIVVTPIVTLWNPYNTTMTLRTYQIQFDKVFPLRLSYSVGQQTSTNVALNDIVKHRIQARFPAVTLGPGESKVYGMDSNVPVTNTGSQVMVLSEGYQPNGGAIFTKIHAIDVDGNPETAPVFEARPANGMDRFSVSSVEFSASGHEGMGRDEEGIGVRFNASSEAAQQIIVMSYVRSEFGAEALEEIYPPIETAISYPVSDVVGTMNVPFATATLGLRMVSPPPPEPRFKFLRTKGMLQANPLQHYAEVGTANDGDALTNLAGSGAYHTINAPYDFVIEEAQDWNDRAVKVDFDAATKRGYIVSGTRSTDGIDRCVMAELPTRPLQSLADLQHFDVRNNNQLPPFQFNLIGNSSAHPLFEPTQTEIETKGHYAGLSNDDSYLLNHVLFDDWFMSSIAPDLQNFSARPERSTQTVFTEFLDGEQKLPNRFYLPSRLAGEEEASILSRTYLTGRPDRSTGLYPFQTAASLFEVEGMFNINSVSLDAWKAVLRRNRDLDVPYFTNSGSVATETSDAPAYPRTTVASDSLGAGGLNPIVGGYSALTDTQVDALAEEIVDQIRERGPFLSLSEFVNRQLTSNTDRALAGTIQRALDRLAEDSSSTRNPFYSLIAAGEEVTEEPPGNTDYKFPEAALGSTNFGAPGWIRQADVLRPLAPIMSARDDTFTIRAYGDSRNAAGTIQARAWCEVVVQRNADYVDGEDHAHVTPLSDDMESEVNRLFGRRYQLMSFRWLNEDEV
ncbi:hypothetical protein [Haloferula sp.]|uniref:hypothetical protein n=1 Tax=Haloferula sp. TaxID=2497595 RepID=UPI00329E2880